MGVRINVTLKGGVGQQQKYLAQLNRRLKDRRGGLLEAVHEIAEEWDDNFRSEGSEVGGWAALAEATIKRRAAAGYPAWPILVRYGALRKVAIEGFMSANSSGSWASGDNYSGHNTKGTLRLNKGEATLSAHGWKVANQWGHPNWRGKPIPARPFWYIDRNVRSSARDGVVRWIVDEVI